MASPAMQAIISAAALKARTKRFEIIAFLEKIHLIMDF
jgi:hypothetical protein